MEPFIVAGVLLQALLSSALPQDYSLERAEPPQPFSYSYSVADSPSGNYFGHQSSRDENGLTQGSYYLLSPDGLWRQVVYRDSGNGFEAKIENHPLESPPRAVSYDAHSVFLEIGNSRLLDFKEGVGLASAPVVAPATLFATVRKNEDEDDDDGTHSEEEVEDQVPLRVASPAISRGLTGVPLPQQSLVSLNSAKQRSDVPSPQAPVSVEQTSGPIEAGVPLPEIQEVPVAVPLSNSVQLVTSEARGVPLPAIPTAEAAISDEIVSPHVAHEEPVSVNELNTRDSVAPQLNQVSGDTGVNLPLANEQPGTSVLREEVVTVDAAAAPSGDALPILSQGFQPLISSGVSGVPLQTIAGNIQASRATDLPSDLVETPVLSKPSGAAVGVPLPSQRALPSSRREPVSSLNLSGTSGVPLFGNGNNGLQGNVQLPRTFIASSSLGLNSEELDNSHEEIQLQRISSLPQTRGRSFSVPAVGESIFGRRQRTGVPIPGLRGF